MISFFTWIVIFAEKFLIDKDTKPFSRCCQFGLNHMRKNRAREGGEGGKVGIRGQFENYNIFRIFKYLASVLLTKMLVSFCHYL